MNFVSNHYDKILLAFLYLFLCFVLLHAIHHDASNSKIIDFLTAQIAAIGGALFILITGRGGNNTRNGEDKSTSPKV